jgi:hypothetical protein
MCVCVCVPVASPDAEIRSSGTLKCHIMYSSARPYFEIRSCHWCVCAFICTPSVHTFLCHFKQSLCFVFLFVLFFSDAINMVSLRAILCSFMEPSILGLRELWLDGRFCVQTHFVRKL